MWSYDEIVEIASNKARVMKVTHVPILERSTGWGIVNTPSELARNRDKALLVKADGEVVSYKDYLKELLKKKNKTS